MDADTPLKAGRSLVGHPSEADDKPKQVYGHKAAVIVDDREIGTADAAFVPGQNPLILSPKVPDGGYGWIIVFSVFMIHVIVDGVSYSFGVLFPELLDRYQGSKGDTSWILSILIGTTYGCGPIPSFLSIRFGRRAVAFTGAILACLGAFLSCFARRIWHLALSFGFLTGLGFGFLYLPAVVSVASWFEKRRSLAVGIGVCGTGVGTIAMAPLATYLMEAYGLEGCLMVYAGIIANACIFAALLRPTPAEVTASKLRRNIPALEHQELKNLLQHDAKVSEVSTSADSTINTSFSGRSRRWLRSNVDLDLMRQWRFWIFCLTAFFGGISSYIPYTYLPHRAEVEAEIPKTDAAFLISYIGFSNLVGRLTSSAISDRPWINRMVVYSVCCLAAGLATSLSVFCHSYWSFVAYSLVYGFSGGFIIALQSVVLTDIVGLEKLTAAFGLLLFIEGAAVFVGPPAAGFVTDYHKGNYTVAFIIFGVLMAMAGISLLVIPTVNFFTRAKRISIPNVVRA